MQDSATGSDDVRGHDRLAMAWGGGVEPAQAGRAEKREQYNSGTEVRLCHQRREGIDRTAGGRGGEADELGELGRGELALGAVQDEQHLQLRHGQVELLDDLEDLALSGLHRHGQEGHELVGEALRADAGSLHQRK